MATTPTNAAKTSKVDVRVSGGGTLFTFTLYTAEAKQWASEHVQAEDYMRGGDWDEASDVPAIFHCEHRYARDIAQGMQADGLRVK